MTRVVGIDLGSGATKAVIIADDGRIMGRGIARTRADFEAVARQALDSALREAGISQIDVDYTATTGLGRHAIAWRDVQATEMTAAARAAQRLVPRAGHVLDMGAQSTRAIRLRDGGRVREFHTNEKCAAGSGGFLEKAAIYLEVPLEEIGDISGAATGSQPISSVCAVLAESEIINHVSEGRPVADVLRGIHESLADRALGQLRRVGLDGPVAFIGGVALQAGMVAACRRRFGVEVMVPESPQFVAAYGVALLGLTRLARIRGDGSGSHG